MADELCQHLSNYDHICCIAMTSAIRVNWCRSVGVRPGRIVTMRSWVRFLTPLISVKNTKFVKCLKVGFVLWSIFTKGMFASPFTSVHFQIGALIETGVQRGHGGRSGADAVGVVQVGWGDSSVLGCLANWSTGIIFVFFCMAWLLILAKFGECGFVLDCFVVLK